MNQALNKSILFIFILSSIATSGHSAKAALPQSTNQQNSPQLDAQCISDEYFVIQGNRPLSDKKVLNFEAELANANHDPASTSKAMLARTPKPDPNPQPGCFAGETLVSTPDVLGKKIKISELKPGMRVYSWDHSKMQIVIARVKSVFTRTALLCDLTISNGKTVAITPDHPVYSFGNENNHIESGYRPIGFMSRLPDLTVATLISSRIKNGLENASILKLDSPRQSTVYNIEVEGYHNFFANGILVHNRVKTAMATSIQTELINKL